MVNPKKDYDLLMRYLQGDALKRKPEAIPERPYSEEWQPPARPTPAPGRVPLFKKKGSAAASLHAIREKINTYFQKLKPVRSFPGMRITTAVFAVLVLLLFFWKGYVLYQMSPDELFDKMYVPFSTGSNTGTQPPAKYGIEQYYAAGNYVAATLQSKKQLQLTEKEKLLTGLAYLHRQDYSKAIKWLEPASNNFKSPYRQQAEFYLALTYLKNEDYDHSIETMEHIAYMPTHPYHNRISKSIISVVKLLKWR
jgi:hypothetical protein